jgi:hypothetical protein
MSRFAVGDRYGKLVCEEDATCGLNVYLKCHEDVKNGILACKIVSCVNVIQRNK